ncbi:bactofilin family protein [Rhizosaccharibacter radicis]|uniref:Polymer-forming cytoskeletal protein n=1 Tax=Rhizosaccharibacter radicis TaxID=2782605 RepID=A0ABT1W0B1_9PROT|nr:polymer-forming cytoskeletal protein [Acetobacteraceae bacterium KSS12]
MGRAPFPAAPPAPGSTPAAPSGSLPGAARPPGAPGAAPGGVPGAAPGTSRPNREAAERRTLVVGRGISVQGTVQDAERLVVEGTVEASMIQATELAVAPGGVFRGAIEVQDAELAGTIDGTLTVNGALVIRGTGRLVGTARCRRLQVEDGGQVSGKLEMLTDAPRGPGQPVGEPVQAGKPAPTPQPAVEPAPAAAS